MFLHLEHAERPVVKATQFESTFLSRDSIGKTSESSSWANPFCLRAETREKKGWIWDGDQ